MTPTNDDGISWNDIIKGLLEQYNSDIAVLASLIALQALRPAKTRTEVADLFDRVGQGHAKYESSVIRAVVESMRDHTNDSDGSP